MKNRKSLKGIIRFLLLLGLLCIIFVFSKTRVDRGGFTQKEKHQNICGIRSGSKEDIVFLDSAEVLDENGGTDAWRIYENSSQFGGDIPYADEEMFEILKLTYTKIDFKGEFEKGDLELYDEYKRVFLGFLQNKISFWDSKKGEETYIKDIYELNLSISDTDDVQDYPYEYFFFDVDGDGTPELGIYNNKGRTEKYFFKYIPEKKQIVLWHTMLGSWEMWFGSRKIACPWGGGQYLWFYQYDLDGKVECQTNCFVVYLNETESLYMVMIPKYVEEDKEIQIPDWMKQQGAFSQEDGQWFFRVTEGQYNEIIASYIEACEFGKEEINKVTYTYEELFGSLTPSQ